MLVSKLEEYPHIGTKKYITNIYAMVGQVYQKIMGNDSYPDRRRALDKLFRNYQDKRGEQRIYDGEVYNDVGFMRNFWNSESILFVLNNQIGDTTLSIPLLISLLKSGKKILIFTVHIELVKNLLLYQEGVDITQVTFFEIDAIHDFLFHENQFCINLHRTISLEDIIPDERYLSLDWRVLPLFDKEYYSFPERFAILTEILMGYSTQIHRSLKEAPKTSNYLLVPRSSLHEKEISDQDWLHICEDIRNKDPSCILYIAFDNPQGEDEEFKYYSLYSLLKSNGFHVNIFKRELGELPNTLRDLSPKVISVDTGLGHITSYLGLETIMLFKGGNSKFWAFPTPNVKMVNSRLSEFLIENEYGFFDPYFGNSEIDETTRPLALQAGIGLEKVIEKI